MKLIAGLGNPEEKYKHTRHNLGYAFVDRLAENLQVKFKTQKKFKSKIAKIEVNNKQIILAKLLTFMNSSGTAVKKLLTSYKIPVANLIVVHDDVDLFLGKIKIQKGKSSAGHLGVESIIKELKSKDFTRIRLGIGRNSEKDMEKFVLSRFSSDEKKEVEEMIDSACGKVFMIK